MSHYFCIHFSQLGAIIHDYPVLFHYIAKEDDCKIQFAGEPIQDAGYGLAVQKGSWLKLRLSELVTKYQEDGTLVHLKKTWISSKCVSAESTRNAQVNVIGINYLGGLFTFTMCSIVVAALILVFELLIAKLISKRTILHLNRKTDVDEV